MLSFHPGYWFLVGFIATFGIAQGARGPVVSSLCAKMFPGVGLATIYGAIYACMSIGAATGAVASGVLHDLTGGYQASFIFSMFGVLIAIAPFWMSPVFAQFESSTRVRK